MKRSWTRGWAAGPARVGRRAAGLSEAEKDHDRAIKADDVLISESADVFTEARSLATTQMLHVTAGMSIVAR